jgi:hypothetical protein
MINTYPIRIQRLIAIKDAITAARVSRYPRCVFDISDIFIDLATYLSDHLNQTRLVIYVYWILRSIHNDG